MWRTRPPDAEQVRKMHEERAKHDLYPLVIHDSYLINLASAEPVIRKKSIHAFAGEMERALIIGAEYLVAHPGNYKGLTIEQGMLNVAEGIILAWREVPEALSKQPKLTILLENTAGAGAQLGGKFSELGTIAKAVESYIELPVGYCLDTCHCFVAGFDIATQEGLQQCLAEAEEHLDLARVPVFHANDAKAPLGSHVDRHQNIGAGYIGVEGFRRILNHPKLSEKAFILETPLDEPGDDLRNVNALKELVSPKKRSRTRKSN